MTLFLDFVENLETFTTVSNSIEKEELFKIKSLEKFDSRFVIFWTKFKTDVVNGGTSFYMSIDNQYHLPHLLAIQDLIRNNINETVIGHTEISICIKEMIEENIGFEIISRNGGLSFVRLMPNTMLYDYYTMTSTIA